MGVPARAALVCQPHRDLPGGDVVTVVDLSLFVAIAILCRRQEWWSSRRVTHGVRLGIGFLAMGLGTTLLGVELLVEATVSWWVLAATGESIALSAVVVASGAELLEVCQFAPIRAQLLAPPSASSSIEAAISNGGGQAFDGFRGPDHLQT